MCQLKNQHTDLKQSFPQSIPFCDLRTKSEWLAIENYGQTIGQIIRGDSKEKLKNQITPTHLAKYIMNILLLCEPGAVVTDQAIDNITFDLENGLRIIDFTLCSKSISLYHCISPLLYDLRDECGLKFDFLEEPLLKELLAKPYSQLEDDELLNINNSLQAVIDKHSQ
jgi:hypothetical protein